jgi:Tol biopolymer transport system component
VYSGYQAGGGDKLYQLWKIPITGGASTKITSGGSNYCISPSFTSDGKYLVYESAGKLWKVRQDGAGGKTLIPGSGTGYDITPQLSSQNKLVFCSVSQVQTYQNLLKYFIWTSNLNGGELTQIREGKNPLWSPDGKQIIFDHAGEIWLINADGTELQQLTNSSEVIESIPSFSDNGEYIVFVSNETKTGNLSLRGSNWNIWSMKTDGSEKQQITELSSWDSWPLYSGNSIYFLSGRATKKKQNTQRIWKLQLHNE